ncbi:MAG: iron-containing alcohol dehydrogenase [Firmicutes bacterium]|nr:iron-containing alcohol dehydrogenase [Bacillota bacterium]
MHIYERGFQFGMGIGMKLMPASKQKLVSGPGSLTEVPGLLAEQGLEKPLIVTGPRVSKTDFFQRLARALKESGREAAIFNEVEPDPSTDLIGRVISAYESNGCDCFIALGGGSNMDAAKAAAAALARPGKTLQQLGGVMKVRSKTPYMIAIPTTAGTGSECTVAAVVTDSKTHRKFAINDPCLCPDAAVLDADLTAGLPSHVVAATGMDALTHAIEAWLNRPYHKRGTPRQCAQAVHDIMMYLPFVYEAARAGEKAPAVTATGDPSTGAPAAAETQAAVTATASVAEEAPASVDMSRARQKLLEASYLAGQAFTVACVGNVHAIAHTLGGLYHIPHGEANAVLLPVILEDYGSKVWRPLAALVREARLEHLLGSTVPQGSATGALHTEQNEHLAETLIARIRQMNREMGLPETFSQIREEEFDQMAAWATKEANPLYPVPVIYGPEDVKRILRQVSRI